MLRFPTTVLILATGMAGLAVAPGAAAQHGAPVSHARFASEQRTIPFELFRGSRIFVEGSINGKAATVLLDSGASTTTLDRAYARSIGIPPGQKIQGRGTGGIVDAELVSGVTFEVGGVRFENASVGVMDLTNVAQAIGHPLTAIIGREFFNAAVVGFDWAAGRITVSSPAAFNPPAGATAVDLGTFGPFHTVPISVAGGPSLQALLDLGNGGTLSLPSDYWSKRPELAGLRFAEGRGGGVGGLHPTRSVTLPSFRFGGSEFIDVPAALSEKSQSGHATEMANVGIGVLRQFRVMLDFSRSKLYLTPNRSIEWRRDRAGLFADLLGDRLKVVYVSPQGPAAAAGIKPGDEIVAIDEVPVGPNLYKDRDWAKASAGTTATLTTADGRKVRLMLADYY